MKIHVQLDGRKSGLTANGFPIIICVTDNYQQKKWRTGHFAKPNQWNERLSMPNPKHPEYYVLSDYLSEIKLRISNILMDASRRKVPLEEIKSSLFKTDYTVFYDAALANFPEDYKGTKLSAIRSFNEYYTGATFLEISHGMVENYIAAMLGKGNSPGGVDSYIRSLRSMWYKLSTEENPFAKKKIELPEKINRVATTNDIEILKNASLSSKGQFSGENHYRNYWLLMFYLGGIDPEALAKLRYDKNVVGERIIFNRNKGRSKTAGSNIIPPQAWEILKLYDCKPFLVPIFMAKDYSGFLKNFNRRFRVVCKKLELSVELRPKSARYTFIDRAQQLLVDERITAQIVGHKRKTTTSIYTNDFPKSVQDQAHLSIIS